MSKKGYDIKELFGSMSAMSAEKETVLKTSAQATLQRQVPQMSPNPTKRQATWQINSEILERLSVYAKQSGVKQYALVEQAINEYLTKVGG